MTAQPSTFAPPATLPPLYREHRHTYQADTCQALVAAARAGKARLEALARGSYPGRLLPEGALPGLSSIGYWDVVGPQDWGLAVHRNEGIEFTFLERGGLPFILGERRHDLHPGDLTVTRPWQTHQVGDPCLGASRLHWLILDVNVRRPNQPWRWPPWIIMQPADLDEFTRILRGNERPVWHATEDVRGCFRKLAAALADERPGALSRLAVHINELFVLTLEMLRSQTGGLDEDLTSTQRTVALFLADLRRDTANLAQPWTLERMANQCGLGVTRFVHYCKQSTNLAPMQYLNRCRLEAAATMLRENESLSVTDVAFACGFASSQYFATAFARTYRCSPRAWRARQ